MNALRLYWQYLMVSIRAQLQYRGAFLIAALGQFLSTGIEFLGIWALFDRFGHLQDWKLAEVALFYGVVNCAFALADALSTGFDQFGAAYVKTGDFDRILLRPRSTILQLAGHELALRRVGRLAQGMVVLVWAAGSLDVTWNMAHIGLLIFTIIGGICFFFGLIVLQAILSFWTIESLEIMNVLTYGGLESAQYPLSIYHVAFRRFFTLVIPLACISYFPIVGVLGIADPLGSPALFQWLSPSVGVGFLLLALQLWKMGVRHYTSTGS
ncbi:MAG: ABC-2 family transporter protein [Candidatus Tectomicrobia bacterium]|nr:ABC-2 family transporter protein [Candidatus Tectomicrobia bacterium]